MRYLMSVTKDGRYIIEGFKRSGGRTIPVGFDRGELETLLRDGKADVDKVLDELDRTGQAEADMD